MTAQTFRGLNISFDSRVLEPRRWTEAQSVWAAELLAEAPAGPVLELCAGVGHIGMGAVRDSAREIVMVDINPVAKQFALTNAEANGLLAQVEFRLAPMEDALREDERFAVVIADPPWVRSGEIARFPGDPVSAIDGGGDGLALARICIRLIDRHLVQGGSALLQVGSAEQARTISTEIEQFPAGSIRAIETRTYDGGAVVRVGR